MYKLSRHIFLLLLVFANSIVFAQDEDEDNYGSFSPVESRPVAIKKVAPEKIKELKNEEAYWYANLQPEKKAEQQQPAATHGNRSLFNQAWFGNLLWIIIVMSFIAVVIWYLASSNVQFFRKASKKIIDEQEEEITEDIFIMNYDREIAKALHAKNYRLATRLWYLGTLKELAEKNIIDYRHEKTNSDYVKALVGSRYYRDFFRLTRNFEYTWYGQFPLSEEGYNFLQKDFHRFKNSL
jgi:hypothetical protein